MKIAYGIVAILASCGVIYMAIGIGIGRLSPSFYGVGIAVTLGLIGTCIKEIRTKKVDNKVK